MRLIIPAWEFGDIRFEAGLIETEEELLELCKLRYIAFCQPSYPGDVPRLRAEDYPDGIERGPEDDYSYNVVAIKVEIGKRDIIGGFRFIPCEQHFFIEGTQFGGEIIHLPEEHNGESVTPETTFEASRWWGHPYQLPPQGKESVLISMLLAEGGQQLSRELGRKHWFCAIDSSVAKFAKADGWQIDPIINGVHQYLNRPTQVCIIPLGSYNNKCRRTIPTELLRRRRCNSS
ncbi:MAG: hypothetical protein ABH826_02440 [Patescibacteria group bacterium]